MDEQIKQIAERLRGLRDVLELNAEDIARDCDIPAEEYRLAETGEFDISVSMLQKIARRYAKYNNAYPYASTSPIFPKKITKNLLPV